ncbi:MAG: AraC family transcriptional regulator [Polyangia bacterium]
MRLGRPSKSQVAEWRRRTYQVLTGDVVSRWGAGPPPPPEWAKSLHHLTDLLRKPVPPPLWWTLKTAYCGSVETRMDPTSYYFDGMHRPGPDDPPVVYFQIGLAGWGHFQLYGGEPHRITPGMAFFILVPSRHRYYLPPDSPGWTFAWLGIHNPWLVARITKHVVARGPLVDLAPDSVLAASVLRLLRGAIKKDFRDRFEVELALFEFALAHERWAEQGHDGFDAGQRLLDETRSRVLAALPGTVNVADLANQEGVSRKHFSFLFRQSTGLTPAHFATQVRVHEAARMLIETRMPLKTIASACGFANANHFSKVFRRFQHLSPDSYRRTMR